MISPTNRQLAYKAPAIVIGLDSMTGLQTARVLAKRRVPIVGLAKNASHYGCLTRACKSPIEVDIERIELIEYLERLGPRLVERGVLFPCTDLSVLLVSKFRERLKPWYHVAMAEHETVERLLNKARFVEFAQEHDIPIPFSWILRDESDVAWVTKQLAFPCVVKPAVRTAAWQAHVAKKVVIARDADQFRKLYAELSRWADELVVQDWIDGPLTNQFTCNGYFNASHQPLVTFISRKLRQWPMEAGIGCLSEEYQDAEVLAATISLFEKASYHGLAYLEMKRDQRDGHCYVVEPNIGRPTGRAAAAEAGGVELLMTAYCDAVGIPLPENREQQFTDVKWVHRRRDLQASWVLWRRGELTVSQWWKSRHGRNVDAIFDWCDWKPFVGDLLRVFTKRWTRRASTSEISKSFGSQLVSRKSAESVI